MERHLFLLSTQQELPAVVMHTRRVPLVLGLGRTFRVGIAYAYGTHGNQATRQIQSLLYILNALFKRINGTGFSLYPQYTKIIKNKAELPRKRKLCSLFLSISAFASVTCLEKKAYSLTDSRESY